MSHITQSKRNRLFEVTKVKNPITKKMMDIITRRAVTVPSSSRSESECLVCGKPMFYSEGQIMKSHKACRKEARHPKK